MIVPRILLTTDVVGGVWDVCLALAGGLRARRHNVTLLALGSPSLEQRRDAHAVGAHLVSAPLKLEWMQDCDADISATRKLVGDVAREVRADVIHANQFAAACTAVELPVVLTLHSDVLSWRRWTLGASDVPPQWTSYRSLVRDAIARADSVVAVSWFLAAEVSSLYGSSSPIEVIHNGWDPPVEPTAFKTQPVTVLAGRVWDAAKGISLAAEASVGWEPGDVYLAGEVAHPDGGQAAIPAPLKPLGHLQRKDLDVCLRCAALYLSPARYDPFGLLPLQAALHGCALLLSDIPSYRELWDGAACFFQTGNAADLRRQWESLLSDRVRLAEVQSACHARATSYTTQSMVDRYCALYARVTSRVAA